MKRPLLIILSLFLCMLGIVFIFTLMTQSEHRRSLALPEYFNAPKFSFDTSGGGRFGDKNLAGKVSVVDFIFTTCMGPCPVMSGHMKGLYDQFEYEPDLQLVSISVDPERDSPEALQEYARKFEVTDDRWVFLRDDHLETVVEVIESGFKLAADDLPFSHPVQLILIDPAGKIRGYYDGTAPADVDSLTSHIHRLLGS